MDRRKMLRRLVFAVTAMVLVAGAVAAPVTAVPAVGRVDYLEGSISITRAGKQLAAPDIDEPILSGDLIETKKDGLLVLAMDPSTGMGGTITVKSLSALYVGAGTGKNGEAKTSIQLLAGSIGSKVNKVAGSPLMQVTTSSTVLGIRGTQYEMAAPVSGAILVVCAEGMVWVTDGKAESPVEAGKAIEKRPGESFKYLPLGVSTIEEFANNWVTEEIAVFRASPIKALTQYEKLYTERAASFIRIFDTLQKSAALKQWMEEDRLGLKPNALDPAVMRQKKEIIGPLQDIRQNLFVLERICYRLDAVAAIVAGTPYERSEIRKGLVARDFLRKFAADRDGLARRVAQFRYIEALYRIRDQGSPLGGDSFFGDDTPFFGSGGF